MRFRGSRWIRTRLCSAVNRLQLASDVRYMPRFVKSLNDLKQLEKDGFNTARIFMRTAAKDPTKDAIVFEGRALTFAQVDELSNKVAHWAIAQVKRRCPKAAATCLSWSCVGAAAQRRRCSRIEPSLACGNRRDRG